MNKKKRGLMVFAFFGIVVQKVSFYADRKRIRSCRFFCKRVYFDRIFTKKFIYELDCNHLNRTEFSVNIFGLIRLQ